MFNFFSNTHHDMNAEPPPLLSLLSNDYLLMQTTPYFLPHEILALASTSKAFHNLLLSTRGVFRHVDLAGVVAPLPKSEERHALVRLPRNYSRVFQQPFIARDTQTLILDGISFNFDLLASMLHNPNQRLTILSIRECPINQRQFMDLLLDIATPARRPSLRGVYMFTTISGKPRPRNKWQRKADLELVEGWPETLQQLEGTIAFDAILCQGPRHQVFLPLEDGFVSDNTSGLSNLSLPASPDSFSQYSSSLGSLGSVSTAQSSVGDFDPTMMPSYIPPSLALVNLPKGCEICHAPRTSIGFPRMLYAPPPLHSSSVKSASTPPAGVEKMHQRCQECVKERCCETCQRWWCESCYDVETARMSGISKAGVLLDCYECGKTCIDCKKVTTRSCTLCSAVYCIKHNDGDEKRCDWCSVGGRRTRELY